jgi:hypothetical protein
MARQLAIEMALTPAKTQISYIRLRGRWLSDLGFKPGARVRIMPISPGLIAIKAIDPAFGGTSIGGDSQMMEVENLGD